MTDRRVLIIGWDGATWDVLRPLVARGAMPTLERLRAEGVAGILTSTIPPITPAAWGTFQTGVNPHHHGVFGFVNFDKYSRRLNLTSSHSLKVKTLWELVSEGGRQVTAINVPLTYPARPVNGFMITGLPTPSRESGFTYPESLAGELKRKFGDYQLLEGRQVWNASRDPSQFIATMTGLIRFRTDVALHLMNQSHWSLFMVHFQAVDAVQHALWASLDPTHPLFDRQQHAIVANFYSALDECLARLLDAAPAGATTIVMSDHGFQTCTKKVLLNNWLLEKGYLHSEQEDLVGRVISSAFLTARRLDRFNLRNRLLGRQAKARLGSLELGRAIDWERSRAYAAGPATTFGLIYLTNSSGRSDFERTRNSLARELAALKDPSTGEGVVQSWVAGEEIYAGSTLPTVPDLVVEFKAGYALAPRLSGRGLFQTIRPQRDYAAGIHHRDGIFLFAGGSARRREPASQARLRANLADIPPTVLYLLGLPVPSYMDGAVLSELLDQDFLRQNPVRMDDAGGQGYGVPEGGYTAVQEAQITDTLQALGYLD